MAITVRINKNKPWELFYNSFQRHPMKGYWVCPDLSTHCVYSSMIVKTMLLVKDVGFVVLIIFLTCYSLGGIIIPTRWVETTNQPDVGLSCCVFVTLCLRHVPILFVFWKIIKGHLRNRFIGGTDSIYVWPIFQAQISVNILTIHMAKHI